MWRTSCADAGPYLQPHSPAMATTMLLSSAAVAPASSFLDKSSFCGVAVQGLPLLGAARRPASLQISASTKKVITKTPLGPSGDTKFRNGIDANGRVEKGKGVYQFTKKYGANVDGYSPIYEREEWAPSGDTYAGGITGLAIWATLLGGILLAGALLVYNTSALA